MVGSGSLRAWKSFQEKFAEPYQRRSAVKQEVHLINTGTAFMQVLCDHDPEGYITLTGGLLTSLLGSIE